MIQCTHNYVKIYIKNCGHPTSLQKQGIQCSRDEYLPAKLELLLVFCMQWHWLHVWPQRVIQLDQSDLSSHFCQCMETGK